MKTLTLQDIRKIYETKGINLLDGTVYALLSNTHAGFFKLIDCYNVVSDDKFDFNTGSYADAELCCNKMKDAINAFFLLNKIEVPEKIIKLASNFDKVTTMQILTALQSGTESTNLSQGE